MKRALTLHLLGLASLLIYANCYTTALPMPDSSYILNLSLATLALFILYGLILWLARKAYHGPSDRTLFNTIIIYAVAARLVLLLWSPESSPLSDDVYRYVWEGKIVAEGYNPYIVSPEMMRSSGLADSAIYPKINHPALPTIYPPLAQYLFATAWIAGGDSLSGFRFLSFLFELAALFLILAMVRVYRLPEWTSLIYAFSPLVLIEFGFSSHVDILGLPFLIAALIYLKRGNPLAVGVFLALAAMIKLVAVIFLPLLLIHFGGRRRYTFLSGFVIVCALGYFPFLLSAGPGLFGSLWEYLGRWEHNGSIFALLSGIIGSAAARMISGGIFVGLSIFLASKTKRLGGESTSENLPPAQAMLWTMVSFLLLGATVYPWYLVWTLPFLLLHRDAAILTFSGTVFLSYYVLIEKYGGGEQPAGLMLALEYLPVYVLLLWEMLRKYRKALTPSVGEI